MLLFLTPKILGGRKEKQTLNYVLISNIYIYNNLFTLSRSKSSTDSLLSYDLYSASVPSFFISTFPLVGGGGGISEADGADAADPGRKLYSYYLIVIQCKYWLTNLLKL